MSRYNDDLVPIEGVVQRMTSLGVFLDVDRRRIFVPKTCYEMPDQPLLSERAATLQVLRWFAKQEGLVA